MIIPTNRTILIAIFPLLLILVTGGSAIGLEIAWAIFVAVQLAWIVDALSSKSALRLSLARKAPNQLHVDQKHSIEWLVENRGTSSVYLELCDGVPKGANTEPRFVSGSVAANSRATFAYQLIPTIRGNLEFGDLSYRVQSQYGLAWILKKQTANQPIRCYPHLANWTAAELAAREALVRQAGSHRNRWRGTGTIFESLRDYTTEDDIRWVDWKATARARHPIARNFEVERHQQIILMLDASRMMTTYCGHRTKFDTVLEAAVLAARSAADQGDSVGLIAFSDKVDVYLHPRRERSQVGAIMNSLYALQPRLVEPDFESAITLAATRNRRRSLFILFTDVTVIESARRMTAYVRSLIPRHLPLVVTIADDTVESLEETIPKTADDFYQIGIASELLQQRDELLEVLRLSGAAVLDSPADRIATRTIETYLDLKRRMRL